jgi:hypothetical protein
MVDGIGIDLLLFRNLSKQREIIGLQTPKPYG